MNDCGEIHALFHKMRRFTFPFDPSLIPTSGIYVLFETGETGHGGDRIVRVGTHTGERQLRSRLNQHFVKENKDRSIFRKNIGRAILHRNGDPFLDQWNLDLTSRLAREISGGTIDRSRLSETETLVSKYIRSHFSFVAFEVPSKFERLRLESALISTVFLCDECQPSDAWLGRHSPVPKIVHSGLWLVNELDKTPITVADLAALRICCMK